MMQAQHEKTCPDSGQPLHPTAKAAVETFSCSLHTSLLDLGRASARPFFSPVSGFGFFAPFRSALPSASAERELSQAGDRQMAGARFAPGPPSPRQGGRDQARAPTDRPGGTASPRLSPPRRIAPKPPRRSASHSEMAACPCEKGLFCPEFRAFLRQIARFLPCARGLVFSFGPDWPKGQRTARAPFGEP